MSIDEILRHLREAAYHEWTSVEVYHSILKRYGPSENDIAIISEFLEKYFVDIDKESEHRRLKSWTKNLLSL